jgi:1,2-diacylglycerol 3-beta-galactosyltransferase
MSNQTRILILTIEAGFGHLSAAKAIKASINEKYKDSCIVFIANPFNEKRVPALIRRTQHDYDRVVREWPEIYKLGYKATDGYLRGSIFENSLVVLLFESLRGIYNRYKPDVIVSTFPTYQAPLGAYFTLKNHFTPLITVVTDLETIHWLWFNRASDLCLVPTKQAADLAIEHGLSPETVKIIGIPVHPSFTVEVDKKDLRRDLNLDTEKNTLLAVGSPRLGKLTEYLNIVNHSGFDTQLIVVAGGNEELYTRLKNTDWHLPARIYNFVDNMPELMKAADMVLCKPGGLMVTEALASGLPMMLIEVIPGQESGNVSYIVNGGAGVYLEEPVRILETLSHWLMQDGKQLKQVAKHAKNLGNPNAAYQIADLVWEAAQHGPYARANRFPLGVNKIKEILGGFGILTED